MEKISHEVAHLRLMSNVIKILVGIKSDARKLSQSSGRVCILQDPGKECRSMKNTN